MFLDGADNSVGLLTGVNFTYFDLEFSTCKRRTISSVSPIYLAKIESGTITVPPSFEHFYMSSRAPVFRGK